jgi:VID27 C-terminal WD40-like domain
VFKSESDPSKIFIFDLEQGTIVQEIKTGKNDINFNQLCNETKNGQKDSSRTILGIETQGMHQIDPRVGDNSVVLSKQYKTNVLFNSIGANVNGGIVVGSANGDIRMYK